MKGSERGHPEILSTFNSIPESLDHCVSQATRCGFFSAHKPTRNMWVGARNRGRRGAVTFFTDFDPSARKEG